MIRKYVELKLLIEVDTFSDELRKGDVYKNLCTFTGAIVNIVVENKCTVFSRLPADELSRKALLGFGCAVSEIRKVEE
jgi:hypothetical protein